MKGKKFTLEHRLKLSIANKGKRHNLSENARENIRKANMARIITGKIRQKMSESHKKNPSRYWLGKKRSEEYKQELSRKMKGFNAGSKNPMFGKKESKNPAWKGGITPLNHKIRTSFEYEEWRKSVFERDNFTCQICGDNKGGNLQANHIKKFSDYPELRLCMNNGITLCDKCHLSVVTGYEFEWESYFYFNLEARQITLSL